MTAATGAFAGTEFFFAREMSPGHVRVDVSPDQLVIDYVLGDDEIPRQWYNLAADLPTPMQPPLGPDGNPISPDMLAPVFPMNLIEQEVSTERWIDIPEGILDVLSIWRPSPLMRAYSLEKALNTIV